MSRRAFVAGAALVLGLAGGLRGVWLTSDPPVTNGVGVVWHDEGAWVHNARNRALWGVWRTDDWNPVFVAPVFTGLEYAAFRAFGVGTWQARLVPLASGLVAVLFLMAGLAALSGRRAALAGGVLLAMNYAFVMWNRAALMESTMTAFIVVSWAAYARARLKPGWGWLAGAAAVLALFTKASAVFFVGALILEAIVARFRGTSEPRHRGTVSLWTLAGLTVCAALMAVLFVLPHWSEFRFYNWQMSVTRKPEYSVQALAMRASWLPLVHDFFTWMWPVFLAACAAIVRIAIDWRTAAPGRRLLALWVMVGLLELVIHDSGNERRYVMFIPALIALAADWLALDHRRPWITVVPGSPSSLDHRRPWITVVWTPLTRGVAALSVLALGYLAAGSAVRLLFLDQVRGGHLHDTVMISAALAAAAAAGVLAFPRVARLLLTPWPTLTMIAAVALTLVVDVDHFAAWARGRGQRNEQASRAVGRLLPAGTLVQGKLANGLSLENRIRPIFIGRGFGNYADRLQRDDVRYILTYVSPSVGFESQAGSGLIQEILDRYPHHRTVATFAVAETGGPDRAALVDKFPGTDARAPD